MLNVSLDECISILCTRLDFFETSFYRFILLKQFHFVEKKYSLALGKLGLSHCLVEAVMFMQCEEAPAAEMMACQIACLEETS